MSETKRILVTGGGKGVGAAIVRQLVSQGFDVDFTYRSSGEQAKVLAAELTAGGRVVWALELDLALVDAVDAFAKVCEEVSYHGLVHNAGQPYDALSMMMDQTKAEAAMQVNFWSFTDRKSVV